VKLRFQKPVEWFEVDEDDVVIMRIGRSMADGRLEAYCVLKSERTLASDAVDVLLPINGVGHKPRLSFVDGPEHKIATWTYPWGGGWTLCNVIRRTAPPVSIIMQLEVKWMEQVRAMERT